MSRLESTHFGGAFGASLDDWKRLCSESLVGDQVWPLGDTSAFEGRLTRRWIDDFLVTEMKAPPFAARFDKSSASRDYLVMWEGYPAGGEWGVLRDNSRVESSFIIGVIDNGSLLRYEQYVPRRVRSVFIPKDALRNHGVRLDRMGLPLDLDHSVPAKLMLAMIRPLLRASAVSLPEVIAIRAAILDLFLGLKPEKIATTSPAVNDAMRGRVEAWVARELLYGNVTPDAAARAQGISLRSLHRLFSGSKQTFSGFVRTVRLERARHELAASSNTVQGIASRWGYSDVSHFCREFKRAYCVTPTEFRASLARADVAS